MAKVSEPKETMFNITSDDRSKVEVASDDAVMQKKLEKVGAELLYERGPTKFYRMDADQLLIRQKPKKRKLTDEQREALKGRMQRIREVQNG